MGCKTSKRTNREAQESKRTFSYAKLEANGDMAKASLPHLLQVEFCDDSACLEHREVHSKPMKAKVIFKCVQQKIATAVSRLGDQIFTLDTDSAHDVACAQASMFALCVAGM